MVHNDKKSGFRVWLGLERRSAKKKMRRLALLLNRQVTAFDSIFLHHPNNTSPIVRGI